MRRCYLGWAGEERSLSEEGILISSEKVPAMGTPGGEIQDKGAESAKALGHE